MQPTGIQSRPLAIAVQPAQSLIKPPDLPTILSVAAIALPVIFVGSVVIIAVVNRLQARFPSFFGRTRLDDQLVAGAETAKEITEMFAELMGVTLPQDRQEIYNYITTSTGALNPARVARLQACENPLAVIRGDGKKSESQQTIEAQAQEIADLRAQVQNLQVGVGTIQEVRESVLGVQDAINQIQVITNRDLGDVNKLAALRPQDAVDAALEVLAPIPPGSATTVDEDTYFVV